MKHKGLWAAAGLLLGAAAAVSPGTVFILFFAGIVTLILRACSRKEDCRFITGLFLTALLVRIVFSLMLDIGSRVAEGEWPHLAGPVQGWNINVRDRSRGYLHLGDSDFYSDRAYGLSAYVKGSREAGVFLSMKRPKPHGYLYSMAVFYYFFGFSPISVKFINCLIGALLGPLVFFLGLACFNRWVARVSSLLAAFFPSLVLWSATNLKDPSFISLTALVFLLIAGINRAATLRRALLYGAALVPLTLLHMTLRSDAGFSVIPIGCAVFAYALARLPTAGRLALLGTAAAGAVFAWPRLYEMLTFAFYRHMGNIDLVSTPNTFTYHYLPEWFYTGDVFAQAARLKPQLGVLFKSVGKAVWHFIVEPTPARVGDLPSMLIYPQMILWYALLPFLAWGAWFSIRWSARTSLFLGTTLAAWIAISALASGNVALVFRVRDMVTPFLLVFASVGLCRWLAPGEGFRP